MRQILSPEDQQHLQDWAVIFVLGCITLLMVALILGLAVRLFLAAGGI